MKQKDLIFLSHLRQNSRQTLTAISKQTNIPISTLFDRLKVHEGNIIRKHTTLIDFGKLGYQCRANIVLKVNIDQRTEAMDYLNLQPCVNSLYKINNGYDFMIEGIFHHVKEMEDFMEIFEKKFVVKQQDVYYIIEDLKRESFLGGPNFLNISG